MKLVKFTLLTIILFLGLGLVARANEVNAVSARYDVPYLDDGNFLHRLDIYIPAPEKKPSAVLVHIHGGGWQAGNKNRQTIKTTGRYFASKGVLCITPNYRLSPGVTHPGHVEDCAAAVAWAFNHVTGLGGDKKRIFLSGHSAGAHLAALLGTNPAYLGKYHIKPGDLAGVIPVDTASFNLLSRTRNERRVKKMIQTAFGGNREVLREASPFHNVTGGAVYPVFLILNTTNREAAAKGGRAFAGKLRSVGCDARFIPVAGHSHMEMAKGMYSASDPVGKSILKLILNHPSICNIENE